MVPDPPPNPYISEKPFSRAFRIYPTYPYLRDTQRAQMRQQRHRPPKTLRVGMKSGVPERYENSTTQNVTATISNHHPCHHHKLGAKDGPEARRYSRLFGEGGGGGKTRHGWVIVKKRCPARARRQILPQWHNMQIRFAPPPPPTSQKWYQWYPSMVGGVQAAHTVYYRMYRCTIECSLDCLGQLFPLPWRRLVINLAHWGIESSRIG